MACPGGPGYRPACRPKRPARWSPRPHGPLVAMLLLCLARPAVYAQDNSPLRPSTHGELWLSTSLEGKPFRNKKNKYDKGPFYRRLPLIGELGWRARLDPFYTRSGYASLATRYRLTEFLRTGASYRRYFYDQYHPDVSRIDLQLWLNWATGRVKLEHRFEYEHDFIPIYKMRTVLRNRLGLTYNIPHWKLDPQVSAELFTGLHYTGNRNIAIRYDLGTELDLDKKGSRSIGVALRFDHELNAADPENRWIFVLSYDLELKKK